MGEQEWYYAVGRQQQGPVALDQLRELLASGQIQGSTLVWKEGLAQWQAASGLPELTAAPASQSPDGGPRASAAPGAGFYPPPAYAPPARQPQGPQVIGYAQPSGPVSVAYAGFWLRFVAALIDGAAMWVVGQIVSLALSPLMQSSMQSVSVQSRSSGPPGLQVFQSLKPMLPILALSWAITTTINWLYFAIMESSSTQGSLGKMALGLQVTNLHGHRVSFARATGRYFAKIPSGLILYIGYMMAGWTERKQALHDIMAGTLVVKKQKVQMYPGYGYGGYPQYPQYPPQR